MFSRGRVMRWLVLLAAVGVLAALGLSSKHQPANGKLAPALPKEALSGTVTLASLLSGARGRPAVVVFWASWCEPCKKEAPALERFSQSAEGRGRIAGVDWSNAASEARDFVHSHHWTFPNVRDGQGSVGYEYGFSSLPATFVIGQDRRIKAFLSGPQTEASLRRALASAG